MELTLSNRKALSYTTLGSSEVSGGARTEGLPHSGIALGLGGNTAYEDNVKGA